MGWLTRLAPGEVRDGAISGSFGMWLDRSREDAQEWLRAATPELALDPAVRVMVGRARSESHAVALEWAQAIENPRLRARTLDRVARGWMHLDPDAARVGLAESGLSEAAIEALSGAVRPPSTGGEPGREPEEVDEASLPNSGP
jgi:hypothetical protein